MMNSYIPNWRERYLEVAYERGHVQFFERVFSAVEVRKLVIVSPWINSKPSDPITFNDIVEYVVKKKVELTVVMRDPAKEPINFEVATLLKTQIPGFLTLFYNNGVHAKIYVCRCKPFGFALLSSANLTPHGVKSYEVGLFINGFGAGERVVEDLELVGTSYLPGKSESYLAWAPYFGK
jgi:hypothetical protein